MQQPLHLYHNSSKGNFKGLILTQRVKSNITQREHEYTPRQILYNKLQLKKHLKNMCNTPLANRTVNNCSNISWRILTSTKTKPNNEKEKNILKKEPNKEKENINKIKIDNIDNNEKREQNKIIYEKKKLKGKLITLSKDVFIMDENKYKLYNMNLHENIEERQNEKMNTYENEFRKKNNVNVITKKTSDIFQKITPTFRYEDYYISPDEFFKQNFNEKETDILMSDPGYFTLPNATFSQMKCLELRTLSKILNSEEKKTEKVKKKIKKIDFLQNKKPEKKETIRIDKPKKRKSSKKWKPLLKIGLKNEFKSNVADCPLLNQTYAEKIKQYSERKEESEIMKKIFYKKMKEEEKAKIEFKINQEKQKYLENFQINKIVNTIHNIYLSKK